jgi:hypothetical protein
VRSYYIQLLSEINSEKPFRVKEVIDRKNREKLQRPPSRMLAMVKGPDPEYEGRR